MKRYIVIAIGMLALAGTSVFADDFKGSIKMGFFESEHKAMKQVKVPMIQAIEAAKAVVSGQVVKAKLEEEDDYLVYEIKFITPKGDETKVLVDPVTSKVLKVEKED
jgi:uncharacterized membrane protein YkoI